MQLSVPSYRYQHLGGFIWNTSVNQRNLVRQLWDVVKVASADGPLGLLSHVFVHMPHILQAYNFLFTRSPSHFAQVMLPINLNIPIQLAL